VLTRNNEECSHIGYSGYTSAFLI